MIITTTQGIEGRKIIDYRGIVVGGRSCACETKLQDARDNAMLELEQRAAALGANAVMEPFAMRENLRRHPTNTNFLSEPGR